jgi:threonine/homoserine/homoserine lactone efflux protein
MARVLALTQLLIVGLGGPALALLVTTEHKHVQPEALARLAQFLTAHVLWLFAIPILYAVFGTVLRDRLSKKAIQAVGGAICGVLLVVLGGLILLYLS